MPVPFTTVIGAQRELLAVCQATPLEQEPNPSHVVVEVTSVLPQATIPEAVLLASQLTSAVLFSVNWALLALLSTTLLHVNQLSFLLTIPA